VRRMILRPEVRDESLARLVALLDDDAPETAAIRAAIASALDESGQSAEVRVASRAAVRSLVRDHPLGSTDARILHNLANRSGDGALRADLPSLPARPTPSWSSSPLLRVEIDAGDCGRHPVHDVAALQDGLLAVALGEAGVDVLAPDGRRVTHFDEPAYRLVLSDARDRAIAIAPRGEVRRLARIDFGARRAAYWCDAVIHVFAGNYNGAIWFASNRNEILAIDATAKSLESLWHNPDYPAPILSIARDEKQLGICGIGKQVEAWSYDLPSLLLRRRNFYAPSFADPAARYVVAPHGALLSAAHWIEHELHKLTLSPSDGEPIEELRPRIAGDWMVLEARAESGVRILLADRSRNISATRASLALRGASAVTPRLQPGKLLVGDDLGRVVVLDLLQRRIVRNVRV